MSQVRLHPQQHLNSLLRTSVLCHSSWPAPDVDGEMIRMVRYPSRIFCPTGVGHHAVSRVRLVAAG